MPRRTIEQSPAYTHRERSLARSRLASRHQQLAEPDKSALGNGNLRKGHEAGQDGTIRRKTRTKLPVNWQAVQRASQKCLVHLTKLVTPRSTAKHRQPRLRPDAHTEARQRRVEGRARSKADARGRTREWRRQERRIACQKPQVQKQPKDVTHSVQKQTTVVSAFHKATASRDARNVSQFELVEAFASANIPLYKLDHPKLRDYLSRNVKNLGVLPQSTTLRSQVLPKVFDVAQQELRERVAAASSIVIAADEASDQQDRFILHIVFILPVTSGQQDKMEAVTADLVFLDKVNATTVSRAIIQTLTKFDVDFDKVVVVLTDNATYMTKAVTSLKVLLPNCIHLTCNAHILSLVGETFRRNFPAVDRMIACFKSIFVHCSPRKLRYREFIGRECGSEVPLPPVPVVTRWNSWFRAVAHHAKYVEHYKKFIEAELLVSAPTSALLELNDLFKTDSVRVDVVFIMMNSTKLMDLLTWFENRQFGSKGEKEKNKIYKKAFQDAAAKLNQYYTETSARFTQPGLSFMKAVRGFDPAQAKILSLDGLSDGIPECAEKLPGIEGELAAYKQCALEIEDGQTRRSKRKQPEKASK
ncbi:hypothetical protein quinque_002357 [Culex quinquefasciatus]